MTSSRFEAEQRARRWMEALQSVTSALSGAATPEQVGRAIAEHGARALGGTGGVVFALEPDRATLRVIGTWGYAPEIVDAFSALPLSAHAAGGRGDRASGARSRSIPARTLALRYPELAAASAQQVSLCAVPLLAGEAVLGAVGVSRSDGRRSTPPSSSCSRRSAARAGWRSSARGSTTACTGCRPRRRRWRAR